MLKICFCTSYFGPKELCRLHQTFPVVESADYFLFTNLSAADIIYPHNYTVITIDTKTFRPVMHLKHNVHVSRYFKFQLHVFFQNLREYDFIYYYDHYQVPFADKPWIEIADKTIKESNTRDNRLAIAQHLHRCGADSIFFEMDMICQSNKDTVSNIEKAKLFFGKLNPGINIEKWIEYKENNLFGFSPKHYETVQFFNAFWENYTDPQYVTYRDQPLWNFMYLHTNKNCNIVRIENFTGGEYTDMHSVYQNKN